MNLNLSYHDMAILHISLLDRLQLAERNGQPLRRDHADLLRRLQEFLSTATDNNENQQFLLATVPPLKGPVLP